MNESLYESPQLTLLHFNILLQFRTQVFAFTPDIERAFHQISVDTDDRDYLRFLLLDNISSDLLTITRKLQVFYLTSFTSPFCLISTIRKHVNQYPDDSEFLNKTLKSGYLCFPALPLALNLYIPALTPNLHLPVPALDLFLPALVVDLGLRFLLFSSKFYFSYGVYFYKTMPTYV